MTPKRMNALEEPVRKLCAQCLESWWAATFPKWLGYLTIWALVTELVAIPIWITRTGPFAWDGLLAFWLGTAP